MCTKIQNMQENKKPLILVTNDDGIQAKGLACLAEVARKFGEVIVVAPEKGRSGMAHAITMGEPIKYKLIEEEKNFKRYSCSGTPADCVKFGRFHLLDREPDFLFSGINHGSNSSINVVYSGTMGAALDGAIAGIPSAGFSLLSHQPDADFSAAKPFIAEIIEKIIKHGLNPNTCLNVNFPKVSAEAYKGIKICTQTHGVWTEEFLETTDPFDRKSYWLKGTYNNYEPENTDTDEWALKNNYVSIVPVQPDLTHYKSVDSLKNLGYEEMKPNK